MNRRYFAALLVAASIAAVPSARLGAAVALQDDPATITHVLNRLTFGPRPGDVERVRQMGLSAWLDLQLHPSRIDDHAADARLTPIEGARDSSDPKDVRRFAKKQVDVLASDKVLRAVYSERQLQEVLVDFWFNHFNVDARKIEDRPVVLEYERDVIRPRVLGRFRDLLGATAHSPAMLFYLDNWLSAGTGRGVNENYGRELMELHTLGVDGGYTQRDVAEVARCFTGWTMKNPHDGTGFFFDMKKHDRGVKHVLGHTIAAGRGIEDGEEVLDILARHPATARFIATKLVRRFVADDPPPALVERAAKAFRKTGGDLREVVRVIVTSREFAGAAAYRAKVKSPFEY